jgi:hypothetical protein
VRPQLGSADRPAGQNQESEETSVNTTSPGRQPQLRLLLPRGVTGFRDHRSEPLPETDPRLFTTICHEVARTTGGRVSAIKRPGVTPSFHSAVIAHGEKQVMLLGHQHVPFMATAAPVSGTGSITFVDDPDIHAVLDLNPSAAFRLLTLTERVLGGMSPLGVAH